MENSEPIITQNPSDIPPVSAPQFPSNTKPNPAPNDPKNQHRKKPLNKKLIIIISIIAVVLCATGVVLALNWKKWFNSEEDSSITEEYEETGESMSGEEYIAEKEEMIASSDPETSLVGKLELSSYYIATEEVDKAKEILDSIDTSGFSDYDFFRYYNIMIRLADAQGDESASSDYFSKALEYRAKLQPDL
ncbi:hypothetical protein IKF81_01485 [Candidatus Saccharibacteria bacterium]|nr:hypothetical protein [Candidatus Saccharibacteria bacterium]